MKPIEIKSIRHRAHRYEGTVGDYWDDEKGTHIRVSDMFDEDFEVLVALHEIIEQYLCRRRGIKEEDITAFDMVFEAARPEGNEDEPGDDPAAPYRREHFFATTIERLVAAELGVDWAQYDKAVMSL